MSVTGSIVSAPVGAKELYDLMGIAPVNGVYDVGYLCSNAHGKINRWARCKPVKYATYGQITNANRQSVNHGLTLPSGWYDSAQVSGDVFEDMYGDYGMEYDPPTGGSAAPYRLTDFVGYDHAAVAPITVVYPEGGWQINASNQTTLRIPIELDPGDSTTNLQAYDLVEGGLIDFTKLYIYAVVSPEGSTTTTLWYSNGPLVELNDGDYVINVTQLTIPLSGLSAKKYTIRLALGYFDGSYHFMEFPENQHLSLTLSSDPLTGGGGVLDNYNDCWICSEADGTYRTLGECTTDGDGTHNLCISTGDLWVKCRLTNQSTSAATWACRAFSIFIHDGVYIDQRTRYANNIYSEQPTGASGGVAGITVPAQSSVILWLYFGDVMSELISHKGSHDVEIALQRSGAEIAGTTIRVVVGSGSGWEAR